MKRNFSILAISLLATAGLAMLSCQKPDVPDNEKPGKDEPTVEAPVFPNPVTQALEAGGSYTLEVEGNVDWTVELKYERESTGWFWIQDGNKQSYKISGKGGEKISVTICAGDQTDFDNVHSCTLEMTMDEETKTIATFTRGTITRTFSLAYCMVEGNGGDYVYSESENSDIQYEYNEALTGDKPVIPLEWLNRTKDYRRALLVTANFDWQLKNKPEWLGDLRVTGGDKDMTVEFEIEGDPMKYPLEDASGDLVFCAKENREAEYIYTVQIPGCGDRFEISGFTPETSANEAGEIYEQTITGEGTYVDQEIGITGSVLGIDNVKIYTFVYVVENEWSSYWDNSEANTEWITASLADWDSEGAVLQDRALNIKVAANDGDERKACVIAIPEDKAPAEAYSFFPDGQTLDEQYAAYVVTTLVQAGTASGDGGGEVDEAEKITFLMATKYNYPIPETEATLVQVTESNMEELGAGYKAKYGFNLSDYCTTTGTYVLTYFPDVQQSMTALHIPDFTGETLYTLCVPENGKEWLSYETSEESISIWMQTPAADASQKYGIIQLYISMEKSYTIICLPEL